MGKMSAATEQAATAAVARHLEVVNEIDPTQACAAAYTTWQQLNFWRFMFTFAVYVLVAATVAFLIAMLLFLGAAVLRWDDSDATSTIVKLVGTLVSAAGAVVTGVAASLVYRKKSEQDVLADAALLKVNRYCKP